MKYVIVDDEKIILQGMERTLREVVGENAEIYTGRTVGEAIRIVEEQKPYIIFSDIDMPGMNGLDLSHKIHEISPKTHIVFVTAYPQYSLSAWNTVAKGFLLKPIDADDIRAILDKVKSYDVPLLNELVPEEIKSLFDKNIPINWNGGEIVDEKVEIKCFGNFDIFYQKRSVHFSRKKSKEMIAYLVDRKGTSATADEIRAILWEEKEDSEEKKAYIRVLANDIRKSFHMIGIDDFLINQQNSYQINLSRVNCDYINYLNRTDNVQFLGEYLSQYSWGEVTLGYLISNQTKCK